MFLPSLIFLPFAAGILNGTVGNCDLSQPPTSWLTTSAIGILDWATAGYQPNGPNFCLAGNRTAEYVQVAYHIDLPSSARKMDARRMPVAFDGNSTNYCTNKDPRIQVCFPFCGQDLEEKAVNAALETGNVRIVANKIEKEVNDPKWAITVLAVDYSNPITHLNISSFANPDIWCSVYIGINPKIGFPYLLEIQLGDIIAQ